MSDSSLSLIDVPVVKPCAPIVKAKSPVAVLQTALDTFHSTKGDVPTVDNAFYKAEVTFTDFEDYSANSDSTPANKVEADLEDIALKLSIGYKF